MPNITRQEFEDGFPVVVEEITAEMQAMGLPKDCLEWFQKSLRANCLGGKYNRGMSVVDTAAILAAPAALTASQRADCILLGWLNELLQAFFLVADDMMDGSHTRRGQPCWFRRPGVGLIAINDSFMLESSIYALLRRRFRSHPAYVDLFEIFQGTTLRTEAGQLTDLLTAPEDHVDLSKFSMDKFRFIVEYKTAYYSFELPVACALHYLGKASPSNLEQSRAVLLPLGEYFQAQDDYLDAYVPPEILGKVGTDIQDNKCSWLINTALTRASPEQRATLDAAYGRKDAAQEARVKAVYRQLELDKVYAAYEEERVGEIRRLIAAVDDKDGLKREIYETFLAKIYKRGK